MKGMEEGVLAFPLFMHNNLTRYMVLALFFLLV